MSEKSKAAKERLKLDYPYNLLLAVEDCTPETLTITPTQDVYNGLYYAVTQLPDREQEAIRRRYRDKVSLKAIAEELGVCDTRIQQVLNNAIRRLRYPHRYRYIQFGLDGYTKRLLEREYQKGYEAGKKDGYRSALNDAKQGKKIEGRNLDVLSIPVRDLEMDIRAINCLVRKGCETLGDVIKLDELEIWKLRNCGKVTRRIIAETVRDYGIADTDWDKFLNEK